MASSNLSDFQYSQAIGKFDSASINSRQIHDGLESYRTWYCYDDDDDDVTPVATWKAG
jgi:hypothetical protein